MVKAREQAGCILKYLGDSKQVFGQMKWFGVSASVGQIRNVDGSALDIQSQGRRPVLGEQGCFIRHWHLISL